MKFYRQMHVYVIRSLIEIFVMRSPGVAPKVCLVVSIFNISKNVLENFFVEPPGISTSKMFSANVRVSPFYTCIEERR
jgi:hypothetical protein